MTIAVDPTNKAVIYIGAASGGVWKTVNGGASWQPVFDTQGSFSIGWVTIDPYHPNVVWVETGERNSQRSVTYGDGVYKSVDGWRSWTNAGLKASEHIGRIVVSPKNSDTVYVAAQGPLWAAGGDCGLFKTTDGGKTWKKVNTGLPGEELGRIGLAISPVNPDVLYANVEAANGKDGIFRSTDNGVTWQKRMDYNSGSMYYGVHRGRESPERRLRAVPLQEHGHRPHVDVHQRRSAGAGIDVRDRRGSRGMRSAECGLKSSIHLESAPRTPQSAI